MLKAMLIAGLGGFLGTCLRFLTGRLCAALFTGTYPVATLAVNLLGCFLIGLLAGLSEKAGQLTPGATLLLITGFCGGFTTFSTFSADILALGSGGRLLPAVAYMLLTLCGGLLLTLLGRHVAANL